MKRLGVKPSHTIVQQPRISNYKISFHTRVPLKNILYNISVNDNTVESIDLEHNYAVLRAGGYVYSLNYSGFINITGLRTLTDIPSAIKVVCKLINLQSSDYTARIDNITASGTFGSLIPLHVVRYHFTKSEPIPARFKYNPNFFSGATLKFYDGRGTIILFSTGSYTIVGAKTFENIQSIFNETRKFLLQII